MPERRSRRLLERSPATSRCSPARRRSRAGDGVHVPFGGGEHDWAALELGAWLAPAAGAPLRLVGTRAARAAERDASRLLADASLAVQRVVDVDAEPVLADPAGRARRGREPAGLVVVGVSPRWRHEGIGAARRALARERATAGAARPPRPAPGRARAAREPTRFTWTLAP